MVVVLGKTGAGKSEAIRKFIKPLSELTDCPQDMMFVNDERQVFRLTRCYIVFADEMADRWARLRTHKRVISRVKFLVEWDEDTQKQRANAVTVDVSHSGCMAIVGAPLPLHKQVKLIHPVTGRKAQAQVVWRDHEAWDTGFELEKPDASFWGVSF